MENRSVTGFQSPQIEEIKLNNYIDGYFEDMRDKNAKSNLARIVETYNLSLTEISENELFQFPKEYSPDLNTSNFIFMMDDDPNGLNANYFLDYEDYSPDCYYFHPPEGKKRLDIFIDIINEMFNETKSTRLVIALTDSGYIYSTKRVKLENLREVIHDDFEKEDGVPDRLYDITV